MTGPEHYREAERYLAQSADDANRDRASRAGWCQQQALTHAVLAQVWYQAQELGTPLDPPRAALDAGR
jgi:hypothetical protein